MPKKVFNCEQTLVPFRTINIAVKRCQFRVEPNPRNAGQLRGKMSGQENPRKMHYHIYWSDKGKLDWEAFDAKREATERALELASPFETFVIKTQDEASCTACKKMQAVAASHTSGSFSREGLHATKSR